MEKRRPSFALDAFKTVGGDPQRLAITTTALLSAAESGFDRAQIAALVRSMRPTQFYKSMTSYRDHRRWQDVYHVPWEGMVVYVKFTDDAVTEFTVLSLRSSEMRETKIHPETGEKLFRDIRPVTVRYEGRERTVKLPGWYPAKKGGDGLHVGDDMAIVDRTLLELRAEVHDVLKPDEVRAIRLHLKLSQRKAGELLGGGPRAFQKYESGEVLVSKPMAQLLRLLEKDPRRLKELIRNIAA